MIAEAKRLISNLVQYATVTQTKSKDGKLLARVKVGDRESIFLPVITFANSFFKVYAPIRIGEQVVVFSPYGNADGGFILRSIFNKGCKEPTWANNTTAGIEFEDGTVITYDTAVKELKIDASNKITIICKTATINAKTVDITATTTNNGDVTINGNLSVSGNISDIKGDLTGHKHSVSGHAVAVPR